MATIGKVHDVTKEFEWEIGNFFSFLGKNEKRYSSPSFLFAGESWSLNFLVTNQNGERNDNSIENIGVYLRRKESGSPIAVAWSVGVKTFEEKKVYQRQSLDVSSEEFRCPDLMQIATLFDRKTELVPSDCLTIVCTIHYCSKSIDESGNAKQVNDFKSLINSGYHSDIIFRVQDIEFKLHRSIIAVRTPHFYSMFKEEMDKAAGVVTIEDCVPDIFTMFVHFMYTGKMQTMSADKMCSLYDFSCKYREDQLKAEILCFIRSKISIDSFCDFVLLAVKYEEKSLFENVALFFCWKWEEIILCDKWQCLLRNYPKETNKLLREAFDYYTNECMNCKFKKRKVK